MSGFKPQEMTDLLSVPPQSFRYWREQLDPFPHKARFTASDLLAYRIVKFLIHYQDLHAKTLRACGISGIFEWVRYEKLKQVRDSLLQLDTRRQEMIMLAPGTAPKSFGFGVHIVPLAEVVNEHEHALLTFGQ